MSYKNVRKILYVIGHLQNKHKFMVKYLGHVRNAADHGIDSAIGTQWKVRPQTAIENVNVTLTMIKNLIDEMNGNHIV